MKQSSIRISKNGNSIRATGAAANALFQAMVAGIAAESPKPEPKIQICKACGCPIDHNGCGCNPPGA